MSDLSEHAKLRSGHPKIIKDFLEWAHTNKEVRLQAPMTAAEVEELGKHISLAEKTHGSPRWYAHTQEDHRKYLDGRSIDRLFVEYFQLDQVKYDAELLEMEKERRRREAEKAAQEAAAKPKKKWWPF